MPQVTIHNGIFWANFIRRSVVPTFGVVRQWVEGQLTPALGRIKQVADLYEQKRGPIWRDEEGYGIDADGNDDITREDIAAGLSQGFENLLFVHLYHLVEQQAATIARSDGALEFKFGPHPQLWQAVYKKFGVDVTFMNSWPQIEELRQIANTVKHYNANDSTRLKQLHPKWFASEDAAPSIRLNPKAFPVEYALTGIDLQMRPEDYRAKIEAVVNFWEELAAILCGEKPKPKSLRDFVLENREKILAVVEKYGARNVRVFGSVARGEAGPASDVDLLIKSGEKMGLFQLIGLEHELSDLLGRKVDLGSENGIKLRHKDRILSEAVPL